MIRNPVPVVFIDESQRDRYQDNGYNPPASGYDRDEFLRECKIINDKLKETLGQYWKPWSCEGNLMEQVLNNEPLSEDDSYFYLHQGEELGETRFLCIEVSNEDMLTPKLIFTVHEIVANHEPDYSVDICDAFNSLRTTGGDFYPRFNIIVEKDQILIYSESKKLIEKLGIPCPSQFNSILRVQWGSNPIQEVNSVEQLDLLLDELDEQYNDENAIMVTVQSVDSGDILTIGIGRNLSVLSIVPGSGDPPYYSSVGDEDSDELVTFFYMEEPTEFPLRKCIPRELARQAMQYFATTGKRTNQVKWEED